MTTPGLMPAGTDPNLLAQIDFSDHTSLKRPALIVSIVFLCLVSIVVSLRIFTRAYFVKTLFLDDIFAVTAAFFIIGICVTGIAGRQFGLGTHAWLLNLGTIYQQMEKLVQTLFVSYLCYICAICFTKLSIIATYLRVIPNPIFRRLIYTVAAVVIGLWIAGIFVTIFQCTPVRAAWDFSITDRHCLPYVNFLLGSAFLTMLTDAILCILPLPYIWKLQIPKKQRLVLCALFGVGSFSCIASIIRITTLHALNGIDVSYASANGLMWTLIECSIGLICVSIPPLRPLAKRVLSTENTVLGTYRSSQAWPGSQPVSTIRSDVTSSDGSNMKNRHSAVESIMMTSKNKTFSAETTIQSEVSPISMLDQCHLDLEPGLPVVRTEIVGGWKERVRGEEREGGWREFGKRNSMQ